MALYFAFRFWLGNPKIVATKALSTTDLFNLLKLIFAVIAGVGGVVALVVAYRRQKVLEESNRLAARAQFHAEQVDASNTHDAVERRVTDLYGQAVEQLGHAKAAVRLGGLYSLERLAQDHEQHRQTVVDVVCAYLRMPFPEQTRLHETTPAPAREASNVDEHGESSNEDLNIPNEDSEQELQVRLAAQRLLARHLYEPQKDDSAVTDYTAYWRNLRIDLVGAHLIDADFSRCVFSGANFSNARFSGRARFNNCRFSGDAIFGSARFGKGADFSDVDFNVGAGFTGSIFSGQADFRRSLFRSNAGYNRCQFHKEAFFENATFANTTWVRRSHFFGDAYFDAATFGQHAVFDSTQFDRRANFARAHFPGTAQFRAVIFLGLAQFGQAVIDGAASFRRSKFKISARFTEITFGSAASFESVQIEKKIDLARATATAPNSLHIWPPNWQLDPGTLDGEKGILVETPPPQPTPGLPP